MDRAQWGTVPFSNESCFMFKADGRSKIYRHHNELYVASYGLEHHRFRGGSVMLWAGIHHNGRTALLRVNGALRAQVCQDEILKHHILPLINITGGIFKHDSAKVLYSKTCRGGVFLIGRSIHSRTPLKHTGSQSSSKEPSATNYSNCSWLYRTNGKTFPQRTLQNLVAPIRPRCAAVIASRGHNPSYN